MPFWSRDKTPKPEWAAELSGADQRSLTQAIEELLARHDLEYQWIDEGLRLEIPEDNYTVAALGRLARLYRGAGAVERLALVARHFRPILTPTESPKRWDEARPNVKPALRPRDSLQRDPWPGVTKIVTDEVMAVLILEVGEDGRWISPDQLTAWDISAAEAWEAALLNVQSEPFIADEHTPLPGGGEVRAMFGATRYGAARAIELDRYFEGPAPLGAIVSVPAQNAAIFHVIGNRESFMAARDFMASISSDLFKADEEDAPLSPHLHWWRGGVWRPISYADEEGLMRYDPPEDLRSLG